MIIETRDKTKNPMIRIMSKKNEVLKAYNLPVGSHIMVNEKEQVQTGEILVKIPRAVGKSGDITGGLPRVTELFRSKESV